MFSRGYLYVLGNSREGDRDLFFRRFFRGGESHRERLPSRERERLLSRERDRLLSLERDRLRSRERDRFRGLRGRGRELTTAGI